LKALSMLKAKSFNKFKGTLALQKSVATYH